MTSDGKHELASIHGCVSCLEVVKLLEKTKLGLVEFNSGPKRLDELGKGAEERLSRPEVDRS